MTTDLTRFYRVAETGEYADPTPVDNVMTQIAAAQKLKPQTVQTAQSEQQGGFWNGLKNFALSNAGRMTLGGLGTAAGVALTGGDFEDALGYGIVGAGNTASNLQSKYKYQDSLAKQAQDRQDKLNEAAAQRQFQLDMQSRQLANSKALADYNFQNKLRELTATNQLNSELKAAEEAQKQAKITSALQNGYITQDEANHLYKQNLGLSEPAAQKLSDLQFLVSQGIAPEQAVNLLGKMTFEQRQTLEADKHKADADLQGLRNQGAADVANINNQGRLNNTTLAGQNALELADRNARNKEHLAGVEFGYSEQGKENQLQREAALAQFKNSLPTETQREIAAQAAALGLPESAIYQATYDEQQNRIKQIAANVLQTMANTKKIEAETKVVGQPAAPTTIINNGPSADYVKQAEKNRADADSENAKKLQEAKRAFQTINAQIDSVLQDVEANPNLTGAYAPFKTFLGRYSPIGGYDSGELVKRGALLRGIADIKNNLIAQAKANGQSGINTAREIEQATAGISADTSTEELIGALNYMKRKANDVYKIAQEIYGQQTAEATTQGGTDDPLEFR